MDRRVTLSTRRATGQEAELYAARRWPNNALPPLGYGRQDRLGNSQQDATAVHTAPATQPPTSSPSRPAPRPALLPLLLLASLLATSPGCRQTEGEGQTGDAARATASKTVEPPLSATQVLERMAAAYRQSQSYADQAVLRRRLEFSGEKIDDQTEFSIVLVRPNKLRMQVYQAGVACDGTKFCASLSDLEGQVLELEAPAELNYEFVHADQTLGAVLTQGLAGGSPQLSLLLSNQALASFTDGASAAVLMPAADFEGRACYRVQVRRDDGQLIAWVDQQSFLLRRLDYPTEGIREQLAQQGSVGEVSLWAEFRGAQFDAQVSPAAFQFAAPPEAARVQRFVAIPRPPSPSPLLGQSVGEFEFQTLDGGSLKRSDLAGKVAVLDFWATWCGPCFQSLPNLQKVYDKFRDDERVRFLAVSIDTSQISDAQVNESFAKALLSIPIARDGQLHARDVFEVSGIPTMFVLGPDGVIEDHEIGFNPRLAEDLPQRLEKLLGGQSLARESLARHEARLAEYDRAIRQAQQQAGDGAAQTAVAAASEPEHFSRRLLWRCDQLKRPGNLLVYHDAEGRPTTLVVDGFKLAAQLDEVGQAALRFPLELPEGSVISQLRTAVDGQGRRWFLGVASSQSHAFLFDEEFQQRLKFPPEATSPIMDAQLVDLEGDGRVALAVGYWGVVGLQTATLTGERIWQNRTLENIYSVTPGAADEQGRRSLWCTHSRGTLVPIDAAGQSQTEVLVAGRFLRAVTAADLDGDGKLELCGIAVGDAQDQETAVGISADGQELWNYPLPRGIHDQPIEMVATGDLLGGGSRQWILAGADGSLHILAADGRLLDRFNTGAKLTGLAATVRDGKPVLLISSLHAVEAWQMTAVDVK